jgi:hypothetical protein
MSPAERIVKEMKDERYEEYMGHLQDAHTSAQKALDALYTASGPNRSIWHRMRLGRAQNALISLYVRELAQQAKKKS